MNHIKILTLTTIFLFTFLAVEANNKLSVAAIFTDHMVLQRDTTVKVWGNASDNSEVTIEINNQVQKVDVKEGNWVISLSPMKAGGPYSMKISSKKEKIVLSDILIGDVWFAGGQSNMEFTLRRVNDAQKEINAANYPEIRVYKTSRKYYESQKTTEQVWKSLSSETAGEVSAIAYYFATGLHKAINVPIGIIQCAVGGTAAESWMSRESLLSNPDFSPIVEKYDSVMATYKKNQYDSLLMDYKKKIVIYDNEIKKGFVRKPVEPMGEKNFRRPYALYKYMLKPIMPYTLKGIVFYQGESNGTRGYQYRTLFPALINEWRTGWHQNDLPFLFIQLPKYDKGGREWPDVREAQLLTSMNVKNTGMVVAYDQGNPDNIHPTKKDIVGDRLVKLALGIVYGEKRIYSGPVYQSMIIKGNKVEITFSNIGNGLSTFNKSNEVLGFTIAGTDNNFLPAKACISENKVIVSNDLISNPIAVRYGWANCMDINLINAEGFPASPFRTDDLEPVSFNEK